MASGTTIEATPSSSELEARWGRKDAVWFEERFEGTVVVLRAGGAQALVSLHGAQVLSYIPAGHDEVLWLSPFAKIANGKAIRGGIPVCWPWFGPHPNNPALPAHGLVRTRPWRVAGSAAREGQARIVLSTASDAFEVDPGGTRALAEIEITLTDRLQLSLTTENRARAPLALTEALHSYLRVGDVAQVQVTGLEMRAYLDQLSGRVVAGEAQAVAINGEIDRIYRDTPDAVSIVDPAMGRAVRVSKQGSASTVLWNPWIAKSARLGDLGADGYRHMVCVETANAGTDVVTLAPGARHRIVTQISVDRI